MIENQAGGSQEGTGGRRTKRNKLTLFLKQKRFSPQDGPPEDVIQVLGAERGRLCPHRDGGAGGTHMSSSHCSAEQLQQEWERMLERPNRGNDSVGFYSCE